MWGKWIYRDISGPKRLEVIQSFSDGTGGTTRHPPSSEWPLEMLSVGSFEENDGKPR